jgi:hypothetical protein
MTDGSEIVFAWQVKLSRCMLASDYPKQSESVRNCEAFSSQIDGYLASLTPTPACVDASSCTDRGAGNSGAVTGAAGGQEVQARPGCGNVAAA